MLKTVGFPSTRTGDQTIVNGNLVIGTSGKGIDFSATPGTGTSELLADYEEGTFTPTAVGASTSGSTTYTAQTGSYTKIGRAVTVTFRVAYSAATGTGSLVIGGLPFTAAAGEHIGSVMVSDLDMPSGTSYTLYVEQARATANLYSSGDNIGVNGVSISNESASIWGTITYFS